MTARRKLLLTAEELCALYCAKGQPTDFCLEVCENKGK